MLVWTVVSVAFVALIWWWRGPTDAMTEGSEILLYVLAFFGAAFIPLFLWSLWLAPYRIINERLNEITEAQQAPKALDEEESDEKTFRDLAPQIRDARDKFVEMSELAHPLLNNRHSVNALVADIGTRLRSLHIPVPETTASHTAHTFVRRWNAYLSILTPLADMGGIDNARRLTFSDDAVDAPISSAGQGSEAEKR